MENAQYLHDYLLDKGFTHEVTGEFNTYSKQCENIDLECKIEPYKSIMCILIYNYGINSCTGSLIYETRDTHVLIDMKHFFLDVADNQMPAYIDNTDINKKLKKAINSVFN